MPITLSRLVHWLDPFGANLHWRNRMTAPLRRFNAVRSGAGLSWDNEPPHASDRCQAHHQNVVHVTRRRRWIGPLAVMLLAVAAAGGFGGYRLHARCDARETVHALAGMLSGQIGGAGVAIAAAHLLPGELWRFPYRCEAEYAPLRVTPELRDDQWHRVLFRVTRVGRALTVDLLAG